MSHSWKHSRSGWIGALSNLIRLKMSLLTVEGLDYKTFNVPYQSKQFNDSNELIAKSTEVH